MMKRMLAVMAIAMAMLVALAWAARSHQAPSGWEYDRHACCHGDDCHHAPPHAVREMSGGWLVTLHAGEHPRVKSGSVQFFVPYGDPRIKPSGDSMFHPCLFPFELNETARGGFTLLCLYVPPGGV